MKMLILSKSDIGLDELVEAAKILGVIKVD